MSKKSNQQADVKNPNNDAYKAAQDNRANQLNPEHLINKPETTVAGKEKAWNLKQLIHGMFNQKIKAMGKPVNAPSTTENPSGGGRGNNPPKGK